MIGISKITSDKNSTNLVDELKCKIGNRIKVTQPMKTQLLRRKLAISGVQI